MKTALTAVLLLLHGATALAQEELRVDGERLNATMTEMQNFGGTKEGGSLRVAYSEPNKQALDYLDGLMRDAGLATHIDAAGNLIGRRAGSEPELQPIMTGSHIDTVPNGGHFDGIVGVMAAVEVARTLHEQNVELRHPLEVVVWSNEEGGKTGSRAVMGSVAPWEFDLPSLGERKIGDGIRFLGGDPQSIDEVARAQGELAAYLELHIEQGAILDRAGQSIGVVEGIVGIRRWNVTVEGVANHAGTTPMDQRQDALYAAAQFVTMVRHVTVDMPGTQVATVGRIEAHPGAPNVIPGKATLSLEIRDLSMEKIGRLFEQIRLASEALGEETGTTIAFTQFYESPAAPTDDRISSLVEETADALKLSYRRMPSGAGHDAQSLAGIGPIGMIFVPSRNGVSHAPTEFTSPEQITNGANVLLGTLLRIDQWGKSTADTP